MEKPNFPANRQKVEAWITELEEKFKVKTTELNEERAKAVYSFPADNGSESDRGTVKADDYKQLVSS